MYKDHCLGTIAPAMRADIGVFQRGIMFAVCSIRQPTIGVPDQIAILFDGVQDENPLFGHKFKAWAYINDASNIATLWNACLDAYHDGGRKGTRAAIMSLLHIPGLGIVKAAFIAQLMGFNVACLDARNVARDGRDPRAFRTDGKAPAKLGRKLDAYLKETYGKARKYWDAWCRDVAAAYDRTPEQISELHLVIVPSDYVPF